MSSVDLFLLGFIIERPWSAYELAKFIKENDLKEMIKISDASIFKKLIKMESSGYLEFKTVKSGEMPEKKIYSTTKKGKEHFFNLMRQNAEKEFQYHQDFNTFILNLSKIEKNIGIKMVKKLKARFIEKRKLYKNLLEKNQAIPIEGRTIIRQIFLVNEAMIQWIDEFSCEYKKS